jgi:hypothetical protein
MIQIKLLAIFIMVIETMTEITIAMTDTYATAMSNDELDNDYTDNKSASFFEAVIANDAKETEQQLLLGQDVNMRAGAWAKDLFMTSQLKVRFQFHCYRRVSLISIGQTLLPFHILSIR